MWLFDLDTGSCQQMDFCEEEDKVLIEVLRQEKGCGAKKFIKEFLNKNWSLSSLKKLLMKND